MSIGLHVKYPQFLSDFNETWILSTDIRKTPKFKISWKSVQWETRCSIRTDGQTDRQTDRHNDSNSRFSQIANSPKNDAQGVWGQVEVHLKTVIGLWIPQKKANFVPFRFIIRAGARQDTPLLIISVLKMISSSSGYFVNE